MWRPFKRRAAGAIKVTATSQSPEARFSPHQKARMVGAIRGVDPCAARLDLCDDGERGGQVGEAAALRAVISRVLEPQACHEVPTQDWEVQTVEVCDGTHIPWCAVQRAPHACEGA